MESYVDGLAVLEERLGTILAEYWGALPLTTLALRLEGNEWKSHDKKLINVLRRMPRTLRIVQRTDAADYCAVLTEPLLLPALKRKLLSEGLKTQATPFLERVAMLTGRQSAEQLIRDAGVMVGEAGERTVAVQQASTTDQQAKQSIAAQFSLLAIKNKLREVATTNLEGVRLSQLPGLLPADWKQHAQDIETLVLQFPDAVSIIRRQQETEQWVMLARRLLLVVVRNNLKPLLSAAPTKALSLDVVLASHTKANLNLLAAGARYGSVEEFLIEMGFGVIRGASKADTTVHLDEVPTCLHSTAAPLALCHSLSAPPTLSTRWRLSKRRLSLPSQQRPTPPWWLPKRKECSLLQPSQRLPAAERLSKLQQCRRSLRSLWLPTVPAHA
jgi:hypothetical protein